MDTQVRELITQIHDAKGQIVLVTAGAGAQAMADLLAVAGASRTILEALVPYSKAAFVDFIGQEPDKFVSRKAGMLLAGRAFKRAQQLVNTTVPVVGVSCTAAIATDRPKKGTHRAHITTWNRERVITAELTFEKNARDRAGEEAVVSRVILNIIARALQIESQLPLPLTTQDQLNTEAYTFSTVADQLLTNHLPFFAVHADGRIRTQNVNPQVLLPGSFNPLHQGHRAMAQAAMTHLGKPIAFEISAFNVDKPPLARDNLLTRLAQFAGSWPIYLTNAPTFIEKARLFSNTIFVVGFDTAERIIAPRYYEGSRAKMLAAFDEMLALGCQFLVAGRVNKKGVFKTVRDLNTPLGYEALFEPLNNFRLDISSTEIRANRPITATLPTE